MVGENADVGGSSFPDAFGTYIRTVVIIDDEIGRQSSKIDTSKAVKELEALEVSPARSASKGGAKDTEGAKVSSMAPINYRIISDDFLKRGIVCALHRPEKSGSKYDLDSLVLACKSADLVVLDWYLDSKESIVVELLKRLDNEDDSLSEKSIHNVVVYSWGKDNAKNRFANEFPDKLGVSGVDAFRIGNIFGLIVQKQTIGEYDFASYVIRKFSNDYAGVMPQFALCAATAINHNIKRILSRFCKDYDVGLFLHSLLTRLEGDVREQLIELFVDEIKTAICDDATIPESDKIYIDLAKRIETDSVKRKFKECFSGLKKFMKSEETKPEDVWVLLKSFMLEGATKEKALCEIFKDCNGVDGCNNQKLLSVVRNMCARMSGVNKSDALYLPALMSSKASYVKKKILSCGTVVMLRENGKETPCVCVTPECDCRRLLGNDGMPDVVLGDECAIEVSFQFWKLEMDPGKLNSQCIGFAVEVDSSGQRKTQTYYVRGKFRDNIRLRAIKVKTQQVAFDDDKTIQLLDNGQIVWLGQLKDFHSQRVMQYIGNSVSKVGLLENEWLRRYASSCQ